MLGISMKGKKVLNIIAILRTLTNNSTYTPTWDKNPIYILKSFVITTDSSLNVKHGKWWI